MPAPGGRPLEGRVAVVTDDALRMLVAARDPAGRWGRRPPHSPPGPSEDTARLVARLASGGADWSPAR